MGVLKLFGCLPLIFWAKMAFCGDMALILGEVGQIATLKNDTSIISADFASPLRDSGFEIVQPKNRSSGNMRLAAQRIEAALEQGRLDRLVVVITGPVASSAQDSWALSNGAAGASSLNVGVTGISIGALTDIAVAARGRSVFLIAPGKEITDLGIGLVPGLHNLRLSPEVTYIIGPAEALVGIMTNGLLDPAQSFAEIQAAAPGNVRFEGFMSGRAGLMSE